MAGGTSFTFVTDGPEAALAQARRAAGNKDVSLAGGARANENTWYYRTIVNSHSGTKPSVPARSLIIPSELVPDRAGTVSFLGSQSRHGDWMLPRLFRAVSVFGNIVIDLTRARVGPGTSRIEVRAFMGNVEIIVPPELRVECDGSGILANFGVDTKAQSLLPWDAPLISIGGTAFMANVEVKVVDPNAPDWLDRLTSRLKK